MKFLNLNTGYSFDGIWKNNQSNGYIFWFPEAQSVDLTYTMPICILTETSNSLHLKIENNEIFKFISHTNVVEDVDGYIFNEPIYSLECNTIPEKIDNYYAHVVNISCSSEFSGEYICNIYLNDDEYIKVGADFYDENESLSINLSNMGVELPDGIQKAFYETNVHEDFKDNIILNRKLKELLSNYWDIIANKGSYKSLINSLKWFEWDDKLCLKEIYKHDVTGITHFSDKDIISILDDKINMTYMNFIKTSYLSLYYLLYEETDEKISGDEERNPKLRSVVLNLAKNDLKLKLSLMAKYFGTFFLPIHTTILHATTEDAVFTNTIKAIHGQIVTRNDSFGSFDVVECNIKNDSKFILENVSAQVTHDTMFGVQYDSTDNPNYTSDNWFGVDELGSKGIVTDNVDIKTFMQQYYTGVGKIIPISLKIPNIKKNDFIKHTIINLDINNTSKKYEFRNVINSKTNSHIKINFNFLAKEVGDYNIRMSFILGSSKTYVKNIKFKVEDVSDLQINLYRIVSKDDSNGFTYKDLKDNKVSKYLYRLQSNDNSPHLNSYRLTYMHPNSEMYSSYKGIKMTRVIIGSIDTTKDPKSFNLLLDDYLYFYRDGNTCKYLIWVSKRFNQTCDKSTLDMLNANGITIIKNELSFYPQFHTLELMDGDSLEDYTISQYDSLCCTVETIKNRENIQWLYGKRIDDIEWTYINSTNGNIYKNLSSNVQPILGIKDNVLTSGYYDIVFKCKIDNDERTFTRTSAFRKKTI